MYHWRQLSPRHRQEVLQTRQRSRKPWHSPPHYTSETDLYMITAACYEHRPILGESPERMSQFEDDLLGTVRDVATDIFAWNLLPNHYHLLLRSIDIRGLLKRLGRLHGRTSFRWNGEDKQRGRKVWFNTAETAIKSERHFWASLNYVLNNAVHHGYVQRWQDGPFSNAA
jgi:putative transposase